jgi:hypothetical protein
MHDAIATQLDALGHLFEELLFEVFHAIADGRCLAQLDNFSFQIAPGFTHATRTRFPFQAQSVPAVPVTKVPLPTTLGLEIAPDLESQY